MKLIAEESPGQQSEIPHSSFQQSALRGEFPLVGTSLRNESKVTLTRIYDMLVAKCGRGLNLIVDESGRGLNLVI